VAGTSLAIQLARFGMDVVIFDRHSASRRYDVDPCHLPQHDRPASTKLGAPRPRHGRTDHRRSIPHGIHQNRMFVAPHTARRRP